MSIIIFFLSTIIQLNKLKYFNPYKKLKLKNNIFTQNEIVSQFVPSLLNLHQKNSPEF